MCIVIPKPYSGRCKVRFFGVGRLCFARTTRLILLSLRVGSFQVKRIKNGFTYTVLGAHRPGCAAAKSIFGYTWMDFSTRRLITMHTHYTHGTKTLSPPLLLLVVVVAATDSGFNGYAGFSGRTRRRRWSLKKNKNPWRAFTVSFMMVK